VVLLGFFGQWLPWVFSPRIALAYHFLPSVPFGCLAVAVAVVALWARTPRHRAVAVGYVAAVALAFAFFYPIYSALPLTRDRFEMRIWFESWR
jgi:dolichyl-phosphate-mannose-protein mannosyltransferase